MEQYDRAYQEQKENSERKVDLKRKEVRERHEKINHYMMIRFKAKIQHLELQIEHMKEENKRRMVNDKKSEIENHRDLWIEDFKKKCASDIARIDAMERKEKRVLEGMFVSPKFVVN
jgi:hypothetical protein